MDKNQVVKNFLNSVYEFLNSKNIKHKEREGFPMKVVDEKHIVLVHRISLWNDPEKSQHTVIASTFCPLRYKKT